MTLPSHTTQGETGTLVTSGISGYPSGNGSRLSRMFQTAFPAEQKACEIAGTPSRCHDGVAMLPLDRGKLGRVGRCCAVWPHAWAPRAHRSSLHLDHSQLPAGAQSGARACEQLGRPGLAAGDAHQDAGRHGDAPRQWDGGGPGDQGVEEPGYQWDAKQRSCQDERDWGKREGSMGCVADAEEVLTRRGKHAVPGALNFMRCVDTPVAPRPLQAPPCPAPHAGRHL